MGSRKILAKSAEQVADSIIAEHWYQKTLARKTVKRVTEAKIQAQCVDWARKRGWWARKFSSVSQRSVPDYLFSRYCAGFVGGIKLAVEFKKPGEVSSDAQWQEQYDMWLAGWHVEECDNFEKFKRIILSLETV